MLTKVLIAASLCLLAGAQDSAVQLKERVLKAAQKLGEQENYAWTFRTSCRDAADVPPGGAKPLLPIIAAIDGTTAKTGIITLKQSNMANDAGALAVLKGAIVFVETSDGWKSPADIEPETNSGAGFLASVTAYYPAPAADVKALLDGILKWKEEPDGAIVCEFADRGALIQIERTLKGGGRKNPPEIREPKGTVRLWIKDGMISNYEIETQGKATVSGVEINLKRTLVIEVSGVNSTPLNIPDEVVKKLK